MEFLIFLAAFVVLSEFIAQAIPQLFALFSMLVRFVCLCVWEVLQLFGRGTACIGRFCFRAGRWVYSQGSLFLLIVMDEWRHSPDANEAEQEPFEDEETEEDERQSAYDAALALLGLIEPFAPADLKRVHRQAMKTAHTDVGGTKDAAAALNTARDLIMEVRGWK